jgi:K+-transporting ATPase KdpF subunit
LQPVGEQGEQPMIEAVVLLTIVVLLFGYLVFALLRPEKF